MITIIVGMVMSAVGIIGILAWPREVIIFLKGGVPICFLMGGIVSLIAGFTGLKPPYSSSAVETPSHHPDKKPS
ncbi:MAG TPA: hypothetical protein PK876_00480 [Elusimicrobiota bacterium]|nr:hypothetical protein [Elusimicrobiota bacterium]